MSPDEIKAAALALPEAVESAHMGNQDFRVRKKVFATYDAAKDLVGLKLTPEQQELVMSTSPSFFSANGSWGAKGWTKMKLAEVVSDDAIAALRMSWTNTAPKTLIRLMDVNETGNNK